MAYPEKTGGNIRALRMMVYTRPALLPLFSTRNVETILIHTQKNRVSWNSRPTSYIFFPPNVPICLMHA